MQALDRTQPGLPLKKGRAGTMTHDYVRHGTTTLFAALNVADGTVIGQCQDRHRHQEWLRFLKQIDAETPADRDLHLILDNYATHKHPKVKKWIEKHPRFHLHFTPTSASWLNMVERFFRDLTVNRLRRAPSAACRNWWPRWKNTWRNTTGIRSRLSGPPKPTTSPPKWPAPGKSSRANESHANCEALH